MRFLANLCNSMIIEMCDDIIRVSHGFDGCQMLEYIAVYAVQHREPELMISQVFLGSHFADSLGIGDTLNF